MTTTTAAPEQTEEEKAADLISQQLALLNQKKEAGETPPADDGTDDSEVEASESKEDKVAPVAADLADLIQELNKETADKSTEAESKKDDDAEDEDDAEEEDADELTTAKRHSRTWERRAKSNAERLSKAVDALKSYETELAELRAYKADTEAEALAKSVADEHGIPVDIVKNLKGDEDQIRAAAKTVSDYLRDKRGNKPTNSRPALPAFRTVEPKSGDSFMDAFRDQVLSP